MRRFVLTGAVLFGLAALVALPASGTPPGKNGQIVYRHFHSLFVINADGSGERKISHPPGGSLVDDFPDWSPDGSKIVFHRCAAVCHVWVVAPDGTGLRRLGPAADDRAEPAWSPSGKQIAFTRATGPVQKDQIEHTEIYVMHADGGGLRQLTKITASAPFSADVVGAAWSPNGKQIVFTVRNSPLGDPTRGQAVFIINADGSGQRQLTPWSLNGGGSSDWSPDGKLILFRVIPSKGGDRGNLYTMRPDGSGLKQLTRYGATKIVENASFSPDGKWITFSRFSGTTAYPAIFTMRSDGTGIRRLTQTSTDFAPDWGSAR